MVMMLTVVMMMGLTVMVMMLTVVMMMGMTADSDGDDADCCNDDDDDWGWRLTVIAMMLTVVGGGSAGQPVQLHMHSPGYCHPNCYERQRRSCSRLTAALRKMYEASEFSLLEDSRNGSTQKDNVRDKLKRRVSWREDFSRCCLSWPYPFPPFRNWELKGIPSKEAGWPKSIEHKLKWQVRWRECLSHCYVSPPSPSPPFHNLELKWIPSKEAGWPKSIEHKQAFPFECLLQTPIPSDWGASICIGVACSRFRLLLIGFKSSVWFAKTSQHGSEVWDFQISTALYHR